MSKTKFFRHAFNLWEKTTRAYFDTLIRSPLFLSTSGAGLNSFFMLKKFTDRGLETCISSMGLPTRKDQVKALHLLNQLEGRLDDLKFNIDDQGVGTVKPVQSD